MRILPRSLNMRIVLLVSVILSVTGMMSGWVTAKRQSERLITAMREHSSVMVRNFAENSARSLVLEDYAELESFLLRSAELPDIRGLQVCEPDGRILVNISRRSASKPVSELNVIRVTPPATTDPSVAVEGEQLIVWQPIKAGSLLGWIKADYSMASIRQAQAETWRQSLQLALLWVVGSALLLLILLRPPVRAFGRLTEFAKQLDEHKGSRITVNQQTTEIVELASSLNHASEKLLSTEQQLLADRERLRESEALYRSLVTAMAEGMVFQTENGVITSVNPAFERIFGYSAGQMSGRGPDELPWGAVNKDGTPIPGILHPAMVALQTGEPQHNVEMGVRRPDGTLVWISVNSQPLVPDGEIWPNAVVTTFHDITERKQAEDEIRHLKSYLSNIIDSMPSLLVGMDRDEQVTQWNRQAEILTGISAAEAVGKPIMQLLPDYTPWIAAMRDEIRQRRPASLEKLLLEQEGERHFYDLMLYPLIANGVEGTVVRIEDVTERARIQELMIQTEKMMSVGGLAAGMAHEINNPLGIITQAAQNIERRVSPSLSANQVAAAEAGVNLDSLEVYFRQRRITEFIVSIREAAARASRIIANMLRFSRGSEAAMQPALLVTVMEQAVELAANDYDLKKKYDFRGIEIVREYQPEMPGVPIVATEIEQVLLNLLKNAAQAMIANPPERKPRIVSRIRLEERYAVIEVEDNGPGMTEDIRRRVFEPFFTTKEPGVGTGLGLSVSYMIVTQNHKGLMDVASTPGKGSKFSIKVPLAHGDHSEESCANNGTVDQDVC